MDRACDTWNIGAMLIDFVRSARRPEKLRLLRKTPLWTSLATFSTAPGFDKPNASRFSEKAAYRSFSLNESGFLVMKSKDELFSVSISEKPGNASKQNREKFLLRYVSKKELEL